MKREPSQLPAEPEAPGHPLGQVRVDVALDGGMGDVDRAQRQEA